MLVPNFNTLADAIDRLIVTVNKLAYFENEKRKESLKLDCNPELIANWDRFSRNECEYRNLLKMAINEILSEVVKTGKYETLSDNRTFEAPPKSVEDLLDEMCYINPDEIRNQLADSFKATLAPKYEGWFEYTYKVGK
jgi:phosphoenolpyruvate synthase/pyruvate phosphate dikinase